VLRETLLNPWFLTQCLLLFVCKKPSCHPSLISIFLQFLGRHMVILFLTLPLEPGGIIVAWRDRSLSTGVSVIKEFRVCSISVDVRSTLVVHRPHQDNLKHTFLQELGEVRNECVGPWIIAGDFNMIYRAEDKNNSNVN
jgi:hypothetical protein